MAYEFNGTNQSLEMTSAVVNAAPLTMACWFYPNNNTANMALVSISKKGDAAERFALLALGAVAGDPIRADTSANGGAIGGNAETTTGFSTSWQHAAGVWASTTSRTAYLNGGSAATNTNTVTPLNLDVSTIGARFSSSALGSFMNGLIAEVGIWNAALTAAEIASLAKGMTCDKIRPQSLVFYAPLVRDLTDQKGGLTITNNNGATVANHPRVYA
jgi:hypothetical protein